MKAIAIVPGTKTLQLVDRDDLVLAETRWPHHVADLITHRHPYADFDAAFQRHGADEITVVLEWA